MGTIYYGASGSPIHLDDRVLAHVKVVMATKLRRGESFTLSWRHTGDEPGGRSTVWIHPSIPLRFVFEAADPPELNRELIEALAASANSSGGIHLLTDDIDAALVPALT